MDVVTLAAVFILFYVAYKLCSKTSKYKLPPGPLRLPVVGSLLHILWLDSKRPTVAFEKLAKKYGPIFSVKLGSIETVVITSHKEIMNMGIKDELLSHNDEKDVWILEKSNSTRLGLTTALPEYWSRTRTFSQKLLTKHGFFSKRNNEAIVLKEVETFCTELKRKMINSEICLTLDDQFDELFFNIIWKTIIGEKLTGISSSILQLRKAQAEYLSSGNLAKGLGIVFPKLNYFPRLTGLSKLRKTCEQWRRTWQVLIDERRSLLGSFETAATFVDEFLHHINTPGIDPLISDENLVALLQDFGVAGTDTQSHSTKFLIRYLLQYPDIQTKLHEEIDMVVGRNRHVSLEDLPRLIYVRATLYEVYRHVTPAITIPRKLLNDWKYKDYVLPKGALILMSLLSGNHDESVWDNPKQFQPERFISKEGSIINAEKILSFGYGKRRCMGEQMAKTSMMLITSKLLQNFSFHIDPTAGPPTDEDIQEFTRNTVPFNVVIKSRQI